MGVRAGRLQLQLKGRGVKQAAYGNFCPRHMKDDVIAIVMQLEMTLPLRF